MIDLKRRVLHGRAIVVLRPDAVHARERFARIAESGLQVESMPCSTPGNLIWESDKFHAEAPDVY